MRLIDADALRERHCEECSEDIREICKTDPVCASLMWVVEEPTVEAEPVRHGRWIVGLDGSCMCSECNKVFRYEIEYYCPNCGARMDE